MTKVTNFELRLADNKKIGKKYTFAEVEQWVKELKPSEFI
jgi:hypothetical protein